MFIWLMVLKDAKAQGHQWHPMRASMPRAGGRKAHQHRDRDRLTVSLTVFRKTRYWDNSIKLFTEVEPFLLTWWLNSKFQPEFWRGHSRHSINGCPERFSPVSEVTQLQLDLGHSLPCTDCRQFPKVHTLGKKRSLYCVFVSLHTFG